MMSIEQRSRKKPRVLFWGTNGLYSRTVLEIILHAETDVVGVFIDHSAMPGMDRALAWERVMPPPLQTAIAEELELSLFGTSYMTSNTVNTAWQQGLPVYALGKLNAGETVDLLASLDADIVCVACFPRRIPETLLSLPTIGFLNVHPSHLPDYRGPAPLFWQLRDGVSPLGVTIHWMDAKLDTGDIAAQADVLLPDGVEGSVADQRLAQRGGETLVDVLDAIIRRKLPRSTQPPGGNYQPWPQTKDFRLDLAWSARRAFNFMRGTAEWGRPYQLTIGDENLLLRQALDFQPKKELASRIYRDRQEIHVQFGVGVLVASAW